MRVLKLEVKKIVKSRRTLVLMALSLFLSVMMAYMPVTFEQINRYDEAGNKIEELKGMEAIRYGKALRASIVGIVTPEILKQALTEYQACLTEYDAQTPYELPGAVYYQRFIPVSPFYSRIAEAYADRKTGYARSVLDITLQQLDDFYAACEERLVSLMAMEQKENPAAQQIALKMYQKVEKPYLYYPGYNTNAMDYELLLAFLLMLFCTVIAAPVFSSDYQTGADDILRCTKHGRIRLGICKTAAAAGICGILFIVCMTIYLLLSNSFFGWECTGTSMQIMYSVTSLVNWNMGKLQVMVALTGLLTVIATICFTLFSSSRCRNPVTSLLIGFLMCLAPVIAYMMLPAIGQFPLWLRCLLPSCGLGIQTSFLYEVIDYEFLALGNAAIWVPYAMVGLAALEVVVFAVLAVYSYHTHRIK